MNWDVLQAGNCLCERRTGEVWQVLAGAGEGVAGEGVAGEGVAGGYLLSDGRCGLALVCKKRVAHSGLAS